MSSYKTEIFKNNDGFFRVKIWGYMDTQGKGRWLQDSDLMNCMSSNHRSQDLTFSSVASAQEAIHNFYRVRNTALNLVQKDNNQLKPTYSENWESIDKK